MSKNPGVAGVLAVLIIGLGHVYLGEWKRAFGLWALVLITTVLLLAGAFLVGALAYTVIYLYSIYDAVTLAG